MGQLFRAVLLAPAADAVTGYLEPHDYDSGGKLAEHSWIGSLFVTAVEQLLTEPTRVVWAGDAAADEPGQDRNLYALTQQAPAAVPPRRVVLAAIAEPDPQRARMRTRLQPVPAPTGRYVINHDQRSYVDKDAVPADAHGERIHPLPVLTMEARTGMGAGIFREDRTSGNTALAGTWARDRITVADTIPAGYRETQFDLIEHGREQ
ncbi:hypothetical protein [Nocardia pseudovaccinii]|uniref:hypothetical protein n=1 Tax=Nocardia pseudovaccinii TaxID=189540 RepID=UPI0007A3E0C0|nr:hypothetical protein [Nocardia pseudovaccinii]